MLTVSALLALLWVWPYLPTLWQRLQVLTRAAQAAIPTPAAAPAVASDSILTAREPATAPALRFIHEILANERPLDYLKLARTQWRHEHLDDSDAYIEIGIWLRYAGLFPLDIGDLTGGVGYVGRTFNLAPEVDGASPLHMERGDEAILLIRQRLFAFEAATLRTALASGNEVELTTESLRLSAHASTPPEHQPTLAGRFEVGSRVSNRDPEDRAGGF